MNVRRLSVVVLVFAAVLLALWWQAQKDRAQGVPETQPASAPASAPAETQPATAPAPAPVAATPAAEPAPTPVPEPAQTASGVAAWLEEVQRRTQWYKIGGLELASEGKKDFLFQVEVSTRGGAVDTLKLANFFATVDDKRLAHKGEEYAQARREQPEKYRGNYSLLNPVRNEGRDYLPMASQRLVVRDASGKTLWEGDLSQKDWCLGERRAAEDEQSVTLYWSLYRDVPAGASLAAAAPFRFLTVHKTYTVRRDDYTVRLSVEVENHSSAPVSVELVQYGAAGVPRENIKEDMRHLAYGYVRSSDKSVQVMLKARAELDKWKLGEARKLGGSDDAEPIIWLGETNQFFGAMMHLAAPSEGEAPAPVVWFQAAAVRESPTSSIFLPMATMPALALKAGQSARIDFDVFTGPKDRDVFVNDAFPYFREDYRRLNYVSTINVGSCFCAADWLVLGLMWLLQVFAKVALGNYGVAIIILVLLVRVVLHPLTKRGQVSMSKMQKLQPAMQKLKEKYADDKDTLNREMMKFYKEQGTTPLLGCLPMFLQMPIWIALWTALRASVGLRHAAFLPFWLTDLAAPDQVFSWSRPLPLIGSSLHLLPILVAISMYLQSKLNPQMAGQAPAATEDQARQQKMMRIMMPIMMLVIFYDMPSGLNLYIMTSTFGGVLEQYVIRRHIEAREAEAASRETTVALPGRAPRDNRPKKPKGPFRFMKS